MRQGSARKPRMARPAWILCLMMLSSAALSHAERVYVSGYREVLLRSGPSVEHRILAVLKTGNEMDVVSEDGDYNLVVLPDGRQGHVLKSFLTTEAPPLRRIEELTAKVEAQAAELAELRGRNTELQTDNETLAKTSSNDKRLLHRLQQESSDLQRDIRLRWFLAGAGVLLAGWVMGWTRLRLRRRARNRSFT